MRKKIRLWRKKSRICLLIASEKGIIYEYRWRYVIFRHMGDKMKRASKILTLILVVVFLFGIFAGCDLVGKDVEKYRGATALTVGKQNVSVGKLLDTFNSYYNNYYYYILYNGWTVDDILDLAIQSLVSQYMRVDAYVSDTNNVKEAGNKGLYVNAEYLEQYQLEYSVSYVKYLLYKSFDETVMEKIEAKYKLKDEEAEDTSRDFYEPDDLGEDVSTYAKYYLDQNFQNEEMTEYITEYWTDGESKFADPKLDNLEQLYLESATKKVEKLNKRIDEDDEEIAVTEYKKIQEAVIKQYQTSVKNNYGIDFKKFVSQQIDDMITSSIINVYNYTIYEQIEKDPDIWTKLKSNYDTLAKAQDAKFAINKGFESYVESLTNDSYIYNVPADYSTSYVFVKNILIPFSAKQTADLASIKADLGTDKDEGGLYVKYRNSLAAKVVADDFTSDKDEDGKYTVQVENLFSVDAEYSKVTIDPTCTALSKYLSGGVVTPMEDKTADQTIIELMKQFNTDVAQHSAVYSYVVYVGDDEKHTHRWVSEFVDATKDALQAAKDAGHGDDPNGYYGIGVSDYGVHIVYIEGYVKGIGELTVDSFQNSEKKTYLDTTTVQYKLFKTYFEERQSKLLSTELEKLQKTYASKVTQTSVFKKFLKENGMSYDLDAALKKED